MKEDAPIGTENGYGERMKTHIGIDQNRSESMHSTISISTPTQYRSIDLDRSRLSTSGWFFGSPFDGRISLAQNAPRDVAAIGWLAAFTAGQAAREMRMIAGRIARRDENDSWAVIATACRVPVISEPLIDPQCGSTVWKHAQTSRIDHYKSIDQQTYWFNESLFAKSGSQSPNASMQKSSHCCKQTPCNTKRGRGSLVTGCLPPCQNFLVQLDLMDWPYILPDVHSQ